MRKKLLIGTILLLSSFFQASAFEVKVTSNTTNLNINDYLSLTIEVTSDDTEEEKINEISIVGIENFNIVSKSQSQATSTNISVIDGKAETVSRSINSIILTLSPKEEGEFILGPVVAKGDNETKETKTLDIKVEGKKQATSSINDIQEVIDSGAQKHPVNEELPNRYAIYFLIFGLLVFILISAMILFYKQREDVTFEYKNKKDSKEDNDDIIEIKDDFEDIENIIYPELDDKDFVKKIEKIFYSKISKKHNIKKIETKSYNEILENLDDNLATKNLIKDSFNRIEKMKYSNILVSKAELLDMIKQI